MENKNDIIFTITAGLYALVVQLVDLVLLVYLFERGRIYPCNSLLLAGLLLFAVGFFIVMRSIAKRKISFSVVQVVLALYTFIVFIFYAAACGFFAIKWSGE